MKYLTLAVLLVLTPIARAGDTDFQQLLSGRNVPLTIQLKDLNPAWRRFTLGGSSPASALSGVYAALLTGGSSAGAYFTKGEVVTIHDEPFLIAYRFQPKAVDLQQMFRGGMRPDQMPKPEPPKADTPLSLALLGLRSVGQLTDIQPFDLERELAGGDDSPEGRAHAREQAAKAAGLDNLRQLGVAVLAYAADGDKRLPPLDDLDATRKALQPYTSGKDVFGDPPYRPNPSLARKKLADISKASETVLFYEAEATHETRGVLFLDDHVERVAEDKWPALKKASGIP